MIFQREIEENETSMEAAIRKFREETSMNIYNPKCIGNLIAEYPDKIFDFDIYVASEFDGVPKCTEENNSYWIDIDKLQKEEKVFPSICLLGCIIKKYFNRRNIN